jgi:hypothetical protein
MISDAIHRFCQQFSQYESLVLVKMQLLNDVLMLLKYTSPQSIAVLSSTTANDNGALFVVYNTETSEIEKICENTNVEMAQLLLSEYSNFRQCTSKRFDFASSCSNNVFLQDYMTRQAELLESRTGR